jgi:putative ABC transport system substrate-binding protein
MKRRDFITLLGGAAAWPIAARGQQLPVIGYLDSGSSLDRESRGITPGFRRGLADAGYLEGRNIAVEYRWADNQNDRLPALAADLVRHRVALIGALSGASALAAKAATTSIPIVFSMGADPIQYGLVTSLNRPGGNVTGVSFLVSQTVGKMLELLHEIAPSSSVVAVLMSPANPNRGFVARELREAASALRLELNLLKAGSERDIDAAFESMVQRRVGALLVEADPFFGSRRRQLAALALRHAIPAVYQSRDFADAGGLMSYGTSLSDAARIAGGYGSEALRLNGRFCARPKNEPIADRCSGRPRRPRLKYVLALGLPGGAIRAWQW